MNYLLALTILVALCAAWALFQLWLGRRDPEVAERLNKCGNCGCDKQCEREQNVAAHVHSAGDSA
ncbi:MAG TPA: hypothetical protein VLA06_03895 [Woeseiaceae bacterium]|jgi:hypothetical protein|nr:hypothetical protein [Woeseiaceae bacterium]